MSAEEAFEGLPNGVWKSIDPEDIEFQDDNDGFGVDRVLLYLSGSKAEREAQANALKDALLAVAVRSIPPTREGAKT